MSSNALPEIAEKLAEDAAFLWELRQRLVLAPHVTLADLSRHDARIEAQLDGIRVYAESGADVRKADPETPGDVFVHTIGAIERGSAGAVQGVLLKAAASDLARAVVSALGWSDYGLAKPAIDSLLRSKSPIQRRVGIAAAAAHRKDPEAALEYALIDRDPRLCARACRAAGELGRGDLKSLVQKAASHDHEECRFWATWTLVLFGDKTVIPFLVKLATSQSSHRERAMDMAIRRLGMGLGRQWQKDLAQNPGATRLAIQAAGALGSADCVPWLIDRMNDPSLARLAAEAFTQITGADLDREYLRGDKPAGFESGPNDDPDDNNVALDPDENLPWPNVSAVEKWWKRHEKRFAAPVRFFLGQPLSAEILVAALRSGRQRQRAAAALELALCQPGKPMFEVRAPGFRQNP